MCCFHIEPTQTILYNIFSDTQGIVFVVSLNYSYFVSNIVTLLFITRRLIVFFVSRLTLQLSMVNAIFQANPTRSKMS